MTQGATILTSQSIFAFSLGYVLCLMAPGPNLVVIAGISLVRGLRGSIPICVGVALGSLALGLCVMFLAGRIPSGALWDRLGRGAGGILLLYVAWRLLSAREPKTKAATESADFALGFGTALFNPITGAYFASQFVAMRSSEATVDYASALALICVIAFLRSLLVAAIFGGVTIKRHDWTGILLLARGTGAIFAFAAIWMIVSTLLAFRI